MVAKRPQRAEPPNLAEWQPLALSRQLSTALPGAAAPRIDEPLLGTHLALVPGACYGRPVAAPGAVEGGSGLPTQICIQPFYMAAHEVTFDAYERFAEETGRKSPEDEGWGRGDRPVINVNVYDALTFAKWLSRQRGERYRLPTETEWEHAARAGSTTAYPWGDAIGIGLANCDGCGSRWDGEGTAPVGSFEPNQWGLYDLVGNVAEWTCSMRDPDPMVSFTACDSIYETRRRIYRNGGWSDPPARLRADARDWNAAMRRTDDVGFRLVPGCADCPRVTAAPSGQTLAEVNQ